VQDKNLIYKILPRTEWESVTEAYTGSADDKRDGFIHFSTREQLPGTLAKHYAGQTDLMLLAVESESLGSALKWEHAPRRNADFPHLYASLLKSAVLWARPITGDAGALPL
jgi:uncharacterized protein (DUF952 family)